MKSIDSLLKIIADGDAISILAEENITEAFDELLRYDLIDIEGDRICLTEKGLKAEELGVEVVLQELKAQAVRKSGYVYTSEEKKTSTILLFQSLLSTLGLMGAFVLS